MASIKLKTNFPAVMAKLQTMANDIATLAVVSTINKTLAQGKTAMVKAITEEFAIKASDVRPLLVLSKAKFSKSALNATATMEAFGKRRGHRSRNVMLFGAKQIKGKKQTIVEYPSSRGLVRRKMLVGGGVSVKIKKAAGRKLIAGAFIGNKGRTVFMNVPGNNRKIRAVETIDIPQMFNTKRINKLVEKLILERFPRIFENEAKFFINKYAKG